MSADRPEGPQGINFKDFADSCAPCGESLGAVDEGRGHGKIWAGWVKDWRGTAWWKWSDCAAAMDVFEVIFLVGFVVGTVVRKVYTYRSRGDKPVSRRRSVVDIVLVSAGGVGLAAPLLYLFTPWLGFADYDRPGWLGYIGVVIFAGAVSLLWKSHVDLGHNWSATLRVKKGHSLVTNGVYRYIRHPMYAAHLLWAIGQGLLLANWLAGWVFLVTFVPLYLVRVPQEEQMMLDHFGDEYRLYISRTGSIIPRSGAR